MRDDVPESVVLGPHKVTTTATSWLDGEQVGTLPVEAGAVAAWSEQAVAGRLELSTPAAFAPSGFTDAIGTFGQRINVQQHLSCAAGEFTLNLGWYLVTAWEWAFPNVEVEGLSLDVLLDEFRFIQPFQVSAPSTYGGALQALCRGVLPVYATATDATIGTAIFQEEDRSQAINDVRKGWGVDVRVDDDGGVAASPLRTIGTPVRSFRHGEADAYVTLGSSGLRDEVHNMVVARSQTEDGTPLQAVAYDKNPGSPTYYAGPYGRRVRFFSANLATTLGAVEKSAARVLASELRRVQLRVVEAPPDPRLELGDTVRVVDAVGDESVGLLTHLRLPLLPRQGTATYHVEVPA